MFQQFPTDPLHPLNPVEKAKGRLQVESFSKISAPFYKMFYDFDLAELRSKQFAIILAKLEGSEKDWKQVLWWILSWHDGPDGLALY